MADRIPDDALVIRGGQNLPENFARGSGVQVGKDGKIDGISVNAGAGRTLDELSAPKPQTGYPGILNARIGVTTAGAIRERGGEVTPSPSRTNPLHATLSGLTPDQASALFQPTVPNPHRRTRS